MNDILEKMKKDFDEFMAEAKKFVEEQKNEGRLNTGYCNSGDFNSGDFNSGDFNSGDFNSGNRNSGNCNSGDFNSGNFNSGYCNTITPDDVLIFNKPAKRADWEKVQKPNWMYVSLTQWIPEEDMTYKEKEAYPSYITTGGYLKVYSTLQAAYVDAWDKASKEDRALTFKLPNFDIEVFKEIFGFTPIMED